MNPATLKKQRLRGVRDGAAQAQSAVVLRDERIVKAHEDGCTIREVAEAAGLSPTRIHQILHA